MKYWTDCIGYFGILALLVDSPGSGAADSKQKQVKTAMEENEVVPDILSKAPENIMEVAYGVNKVTLGNVMTPATVSKAPSIINWNGEENSFYTVCMIDPDAPSRTNHKARSWEHWLVGNVPGNKMENGEVICSYAGPTPPPGTGLHRYVFLVYKQPGKLKFDEPKITNPGGNRAKFSVSNFAEKYKLGDPVAGNFFLAKA